MDRILQYVIGEVIDEDSQSLLYRGTDTQSQEKVLLKVLRETYPSLRSLALLQNEYELAGSLDLDEVVRPRALEKFDNGLVLILEDFGGLPLHRLGEAYRTDLEAFTRLGATLADILGEIHRRQVIHKNLIPGSIYIDAATGAVKLTGFGLATRLSRENQAIRSPRALEANLAYISPEQTGRMNRVVDYRTDFYSLGVVLYELLVGTVPFPVADPLGAVHSHLARLPEPPSTRNPEIPRVLSDLVMRLLAKNAEDRYQSAYGLRADLNLCLDQWNSHGAMSYFPPGRRDLADRFEIPQKLYGRDAEMTRLLAGFERVCQGGSEMVLVAGYSGIGKTTLVNEVHRPIIRPQDGDRALLPRFISGKFDPFNRNMPYSALIQAFAELVRQLLIEDEEQIAAWKDRLQNALGDVAQVIVDVIPEIELMIGPQPPVPELAPSEAHNRFRLVFQNFIQVFTRPHSPLVIFLDDVQWADGSSLELLHLLMTLPDCHHLYVIGAYRDNEVDEGHPLVLNSAEIEAGGGKVERITLAPLATGDIVDLVSDAFHCQAEAARPLAQVVLDKTGGNPFFIGEFLRALYDEGLLTFVHNRGGWSWDLDRIQTHDITDNVIDLMEGRLRRLEGETRGSLELAACMGSRFDVRALSLVLGKDGRETVSSLWPAVTAGLVYPLGDAYRLINLGRHGGRGEVEAEIEFKFAHDQVRQAAYNLIPARDVRAIHWRIGQTLLHGLPEEDRDLFDIVNHLDLGWSADRAGSEALVRLNLRAGIRAKSSSAYQVAHSYLSFGLDLLLEDAWNIQYDLTLALHVETAEAAYLIAEFARMDELVAIVETRARHLLDKVRIYEVKIQALIARHRLAEAVRFALPVLKLLGMSFPEKPGKPRVLWKFVGTKLALAGKEVEDLAALEEMQDPMELAARRILRTVSSVSYLAAPDLFPLLVFKQVELSVKGGNSAESAYAYALYGISLCGVVGDIETGYRFGQLALDLLDRFDARDLKAKIFMSVHAYIRPWKENIGGLTDILSEGIQSGLETGDVEFAAYLASMKSMAAYYSGGELVALEREMRRYGDFSDNLKQERTLHFFRLYRQAVLNLLGKSDDPCRLVGASYDEQRMFPQIQEANDFNIFCHFYLNKLILSYLFRQYDEAVENADRFEKYIEGYTGLYALGTFHFYDSLARLAHAPRAKSTLKKVARNQQKLAKWSRYGPMNFAHKHALVEAEKERVAGRDSAARDHYDRAISLAEENGYLNELGLASELAARSCLDSGVEHLARHYLRDAHHTYLQWGATAKVEDLVKRYPQFLSPQRSGDEQSTASSADDAHTADVLDLASVAKASQAISGEIVFDRLLERLMRIVAENSGAQRGCLILAQEDGLHVVADMYADRDEFDAMDSVPLEDREDLPLSIVNYVARVREQVVLNDASQEGMFARDRYIEKHRPKSLLVAPIIHQTRLTAILCLENNLATDAFTPDRLEVLNMLSSQAAISIVNASLYKDLEDAKKDLETYSQTLEQKVEERTEELRVLNEGLAEELQTAHEMQMGLMPKDRPEIGGVDIAGSCLPATQVGGDFYQYFGREDEFSMCLADVTGHGMRAAIPVVMFSGMLSNQVERKQQLTHLFDDLNSSLYNLLDRRTSICFVMGRLSLPNHRLQVSNCACPYPFHYRAATGEIAELQVGGYPLGIRLDGKYTSVEVDLEPGDRIVFYSDGIIEAKNPGGEIFGFARTTEVVLQGCRLAMDAQQLIDHLIGAVQNFSGDELQGDDQTVVVLRLEGEPIPASPAEPLVVIPKNRGERLNPSGALLKPVSAAPPPASPSVPRPPPPAGSSASA